LGRTLREAIAPGPLGRRRIPLRYDQFKPTLKIGTATVALLVVLRLALGCHFFYEGVWKITHPEFSAESYLTMAKGPFAWVFHGMVYDMDGSERLAIEPCVRIDDAWEAEQLREDDASPDDLRTSWETLERNAITRFERGLNDEYTKNLKKGEKLSPEQKREIEQKVAAFRRAAELALWDALDELEGFARSNEREVLEFFADEQRPTAGEVPKAVKSWFVRLSEIETRYLDALAGVIAEHTGGKKPSLRGAVPQIDEGVKLEQILRGGLFRNLEGVELFRVDECIDGAAYTDTLKKLKSTVEDDFELTDRERHAVAKACREYCDSVRLYLTENQEDIEAHFGSARRLAERRQRGSNEAQHAKERMWEEKQKLQAEVNGWLGELDTMQDDYVATLWDVLNQGVNLPDSEQQVRSVSLPWTRMDMIDFSVTYGLTAIGLCLLLGLFTRPAAIGGAVFMLFVVLTQPAWPTIYPPAPPVVGHALLINKDFIEMLALCLLATTAAGRWAGLDYFVETYVVDLYRRLRPKTAKQEGA